MAARARATVTVTAPEGWSAADRDRMAAVVTRAIRRAAAAVQVPVTLDGDGPPPSRVTPVTGRRASGQFDPAAQDGQHRYRVPSFDEAGAEIGVPVRRAQFGEQQVFGGRTGTVVASGEDLIIREDLGRTLVLRAPGNTYVYAGGSPYVQAANLPLALQWGRYLFGGSGFAVWERTSGGAPTTFTVAGLLEPLRIADLGGPPPPEESGPVAPWAGELTIRSAAAGQWLQSSGSRRIVTVVTSDEVAVLSQHGPWSRAGFEAARAAVHPLEREIGPSEAGAVAESLLGAGPAAARDERTLALLVNMDRAVFAAMPWERRARYIELLVNADRGALTVLEIFQATRSEAELEAISAVLRRRGVYERLFRVLDQRVYDLLLILGAFRPAVSLDWRYLLDLYVELGIAPNTGRELERMADGVLGWLAGNLEGIAFLLTKPGEVVKAVAHLPELWWVMQKAQFGDPAAQALIDQAVSKAGASLAKALRGLRYADELGQPPGRRGGAAIAGDVLGRLRYALVLEVLSWFVGIGEIKAALRGARLSDRIAGVSRVLGRLGKTGDVAAGARAAARLERLATTMERLVGELPWPKETLARLAEAIPAGRLDEFLEALRFVRPDHFGELDVDVFKALAGRPAALAFLREAGSDVFSAAFRRAGRDWDAFDRLVQGLAQHRATMDPVAYQRFLERLVRGEAGAFDEAVAAGLVARLRAGRRESLLAELDMVQDDAVRNRWAAQMAELAERELDGLEEVARLARQGGGGGGFDWVSEALELAPAVRRDLLQFVEALSLAKSRVPVHGLDRSLRAFFEYGRWNLQGSMGQFRAAVALVERYGARELWFEHPWLELGLRRHSDLVADLPRGMTHVEVKTNLTGDASFDRWEIVKDLTLHAKSDYRELLYLYHPDVAGQLPQRGRQMLDLFAAPDVIQRFADQGLDLARARQAFERWLEAGGLTTY